MLELRNFACGYGDVQAVHGISFSVAAATCCVMLGTNGAGKTSTVLSIVGQVRCFAGEILFEGEDLANTSAASRVRRGIAVAPEGRRLFADLSVRENLQVGAYTRKKTEIAELEAQVLSYFPRLQERLNQLAGSLSGGEQQMLALGRALMAKPRLLIVDELSLGLMPKVIDNCYAVLDQLKQKGLTLLLVEQNTEKALQVADHVVVLESGRVRWQGSAAEARQLPNLSAMLLGQG